MKTAQLNPGWFFAGMMVVILVFIMTTQLITPIKDSVVDVRGTTKLNCSSSGISTGQKAACIVVDWYMFAYVGLALSASFSLFLLRKKTGGG